MKTTLLLLLLVFQAIAYAPDTAAQVHHRLMGDRHFSSLVGAENLLTLHKGLFVLEDRVLKPRWTAEQTLQGKLLGITYRLGKGILLDYPVDLMLALVQHEVFGHGARAREFGLTTEKYKLWLPWPYGPQGGYISVSGQRQPLHEGITFTMDGVGGNAVLASRVRDRGFQRGRLHYREALLYILASNDLSSYLFKTPSTGPAPRNDIRSFLAHLDQYERFPGAGFAENHLDLHDLRRLVLVQAVNPYLALTLYAFAVHYLWRGEPTYELPAFHVRGIRYLPAIQMGLTPFGVEYFFENLLARDGTLLKVYARYGDGPPGASAGGGLHATCLLCSGPLNLDLHLDVWAQPNVALDEQDLNALGRSAGGSVQATLFYRIRRPQPSLYLVGQVGYKTRGFLPGEYLDEGVLLRIGLSFQE